ncbi:MAG: exodeoxyribonuclease VII large subunit [Bacteroidota bacterium]|nr:exodeoxyribonuclease VII large subunit [Bacteroidota bacterium]
MPEIIQDKKIFSLLEVTQSIQKTIAERYTSSFWVKAEMNKLNHYSHSGHCYPELVEKKGGKVIAQMKSNLWKSDYLAINERFLKVLKEPLKDGIKILFCATIHADPVYGLNLRIIDIDPSFSLGELEREKQETIDRLIKENIFNLNKIVHLPLLPQRIAIISVETSKGYADFIKVIDTNAWGYKFFHMLFPALLQGDKSIGAIMNQLRNIKKVLRHFDVVAIIRGGGGDVGLSSFNHYQLAREIALFPIPVITGIGHASNETVAEMVAFQNAITPTELADFLLQKFHNFSVPVQNAEKVIIGNTQQILKDEKAELINTMRYFRSVSVNMLAKNKHIIQTHSISLISNCRYRINHEKNSQNNMSLNFKRASQAGLAIPKIEISNIEKSVNLLDPVHVLKRGYSITMHKGKAIRSIAEVNIGETLVSTLADGELISEIKSKQENKDYEG